MAKTFRKNASGFLEESEDKVTEYSRAQIEASISAIETNITTYQTQLNEWKSRLTKCNELGI